MLRVTALILILAFVQIGKVDGTFTMFVNIIGTEELEALTFAVGNYGSKNHKDYMVRTIYEALEEVGGLPTYIFDVTLGYDPVIDYHGESWPQEPQFVRCTLKVVKQVNGLRQLTQATCHEVQTTF